MKIDKKLVTKTDYVLQLDDNEAYALFHWLDKSVCSLPTQQREAVKAIRDELSKDFY